MATQEKELRDVKLDLLKDNGRSRPATEQEIALLEAAPFDPKGNETQTVGSTETTVVEIPKYIFCMHKAAGVPVKTFIDCSQIDAAILVDHFSNSIKIRTSTCSGYFARNEEVEHFYVLATEEGLRGYVEERESGPRYSFKKWMTTRKAVKAGSANDDQKQYHDRFLEQGKADIALALEG